MQYKPRNHKLLREIRSCQLCQAQLSHGPKPVLNFTAQSRILIAGQAPGLKVHETEIPWNDASGDRLRVWLGVDKKTFYDPNIFAIVPMGFCYPGKGKSGDLPPRPECAKRWMEPVLQFMPSLELKILIGGYAQKYFLGERARGVTEVVRHWREFYPEALPLPHPSPRNNIWLKKNEWFERDLLPEMQKKVKALLLK